MEKKDQPSANALLAENQEYREKYLHKLPNSLFATNRKNFIQKFKQSPHGSQGRQLALLRGNSEVPMYHADVNYLPFQESYFYYLFGAIEDDCYGLIDFDREAAILFVPAPSKLLEIWMTMLSKEEFAKKYEMEVHYSSELEQFITDFAPSKIHLLHGVNSDSGLEPTLPEEKYYSKHSVEKAVIFDLLGHCRVIKSEEEISVMRWASKISTECHIKTMQTARPGMRESSLGAFFHSHGQLHYFTHITPPYNFINCCGPNNSTLHYVDCDRWMADGEMVLIDQAHNVHHYASDLTTTWPVNGKFTQKQREIYELALKANREVMKAAKPGVSWVNMHMLAEKVILQGLIDLGLIHGDLQTMLDGRLAFVFMPHGLGHLIGLDVHDAGAYVSGTPERIMKPGLKNLRTARVLEKGIMITVEPGIYFRDYLLEAKDLNSVLAPMSIVADHQQFLALDKIREYQKEISGVRIEDVVLITEDGCENLSDGLPRTVDEIEKCMRGEPFK